MQEDYKAMLKATNLKGALISLKEASMHLERAGETALLKQCKKLGKDIVKRAYDEFHEKYPNLWRGLEGEER